MVARGRGRGRGGQAAKAKAAAPVAEPAPAEAVPETTEVPAVDNNGTEDQAPEEQTETKVDESVGEDSEMAENSEQTQEGSKDADAKPEDKKEEKEEKVESGKLLVENLPSSYLFDYQDKLKELFSKHGEVLSVKRGPIIVTELTTTPTLSAIVEFKNKDSLEKALSEEGTVLDGSRIAVAVESRSDTAVLVGVPYEASTEYVKLLFSEAGAIAQIHEFSKTKYKILRVTFQEKEAVEKALKLDRELRINGFMVTVSKYRDEDEQKNANQNKNKRQHQNQQNRNSAPNVNNANNSPQQRNNNNFRGGRGGAFTPRGNFRDPPSFPPFVIHGGRGRGGAGFPARGGGFPRGGFAGGINNFMPAPYMPRPQGYMNDGQRPNKRLRQM